MTDDLLFREFNHFHYKCNFLVILPEISETFENETNFDDINNMFSTS